jgi:hypothetical protein
MSPSLNPIHWRLSTTPRTWRSSSIVFSFDWNRISVKFCSIFNNLCTTGWNIKKLIQCTHMHPVVSNSTKSTARGTVAWKLLTWQGNKQMKTRGVSHCHLAIFIKKYLKAREEVWKLILSPTSINEKITYVYILKAKTQYTQPDKPIGTPKSSSLPELQGWEFQWREFHLPTIGFEQRIFFVIPGPRRVYTSEWPSPCTQPLLTYCQKRAKAVRTTSSWENIKS